MHMFVPEFVYQLPFDFACSQILAYLLEGYRLVWKACSFAAIALLHLSLRF
jgi:hypothetical protein